MKKTKKELEEENKKLRKVIDTYSEFWETDAIEESVKTTKNVRNILLISGVILLLLSSFLLGLTMS